MFKLHEYHYSVIYPEISRARIRKEPITTVDEFTRIFTELGGGQERVREVAQELTGEASLIWNLVTTGSVESLGLVIGDQGDMTSLTTVIDAGTLSWVLGDDRIELYEQ